MAVYKSSCRKSIASYSLKIDQLPLQEAPNSLTLYEDMKALIIVTVLAMVTSAIAVPLSPQAKALLAAMQDNAKIEGLLSDIKKLDPTMLRDGMRLLNEGDARVQQDSLQEEMNEVEEDIKQLVNEQQPLQHQNIDFFCRKFVDLYQQYLSQLKTKQETDRLIGN